MQYSAACGFQLLDHRPRAVPSRLNDLDAFVYDDLGVAVVVGGDEGGEEGQVDAEGGGGHGAASADLFAEVFGSGLREGCELGDGGSVYGCWEGRWRVYDAESACVADGAGEFCVADPGERSQSWIDRMVYGIFEKYHCIPP